MNPSVGYLNSILARVGGNLNNNFQKSQMPGGLPGGGMLKLRFDRYINRITSRPFRDKNNNNKYDSFFRLDFNVYVTVDNRERARARDKHQRIPISLEEKQKIYRGGEKKGKC